MYFFVFMPNKHLHRTGDKLWWLASLVQLLTCHLLIGPHDVITTTDNEATPKTGPPVLLPSTGN
jgi:hypothetical protein